MNSLLKTSEQREFLGSRKLSVHITNRRGKTYVNTVNLNFAEEPTGTPLYVKKTEDGYLLNRNPLKDAVVREVKSMRNYTHLKPQQYLNFRNLWNGDHVPRYNLYRVRTGYQLVEIPVAEADKVRPVPRPRKPANELKVSNNNMVRIPSSYYKEFVGNKTKEEYCLVLEEHYAPYFYIKVKAVRKEDAEKIAMTPQIKPLLLERKLNEDVLVHKVSLRNIIYLNRFLMEKGNLNFHSKLYCHRVKDGSLIIENGIQICDICGKPVRQMTDIMYEMDLCGSCNTSAKLLKKHLDGTGRDLDAVHSYLKQVSEQLTEIYNMAKI